MPIWDKNYVYKVGFFNKINTFLTSIIWTRDLHAHYRIWSLVSYMRKNLPKDKKINILEVGCWTWINLIEINKINSNIYAEWYDLDEEAIILGKKIIDRNSIKNINLHIEDITKLDISKNTKYDYILFMDILEHIEGDSEFLSLIQDFFVPGTEIAISVPTKKYKHIFWEKFHKDAWHVRDGYSYEDILNLFSPYWFKMHYVRYSAWPIAQIWLRLFYRISMPGKHLNGVYKIFLLFLFKYIDFLNSAENSCSMFLVLKK